MSFNLIESVKEILSGDMTNRMAGILGESPANVQQAIQGIIPAILTGVLLKTDSGDANDTLNLATAAARIRVCFCPIAARNGPGRIKRGRRCRRGEALKLDRM